MGFHEDDRIRRKNKLYNDAYDTYSLLKSFGHSDAEIVTECNKLISHGIRNEIYSTVIRIVGGSRGETT